nr:unnamed protein product [Digitaria exilis]
MKFYSLSSGLAKHLLTATDGTEIEIPFELTAEEEVIIRFPLTSFILGRSGTGKTTVLTMKLYQVEQQSLIASQGIDLDEVDLSVVDHKNCLTTKDSSKRDSFVKQVLITVSPKLCSAIKNHICRLKRFGSGDVSDEPNTLHMHDVIDDLEEFTDVPDNFTDLEHGHYPLTITYHFVNSLHSSLVSEGYNGDLVDFIYIDEVQDLTMSQIALLKYVCRNFKEGFIFAGDTAQTIARGIDFRFEDVRSLFYTSFLSETETCNQGTKYGKQARLTDMFQLTQNFRTHCGVLRMAQSIMSLLYNYFPSCVDKLNPETGLVYGEAPVLLESDNDENAIMTIFGESRNEHSDQLGFGAEQVILVRDDDMKKQIVNLVGKQALVLTIVECKGLEFQDVLLYNFFSSSPLRNKWRVVYDYMESKYIVASSEVISHPGFDRNKHYLLCSELKQLYVAITRTRQRLWICENADDYCRPMFDYWKKLCIVEVRLLDSSLIQAMQTGSSADDWRLRGTKELPMHETKACNVTTGNFSMTRVRDNNMESRIEMYLTDNNISFWEKFESIQVFMHGQKIISFMRWEKTSMEEPERRNEAAPVVLFHTDKDDETNGYSDNEPDIGGRNVLELTKEEATSACCSTSKKAQKQKNKKSRKSKRSGRK